MAIFPLLIVLCLCGFDVFEYPQGQPRLLFSIFYILISWSLHIYLIIKAKIFCQTVKLFKFDLPIQVIANMIIGMLNVVLTLYYDKVWYICIAWSLINKLQMMNSSYYLTHVCNLTISWRENIREACHYMIFLQKRSYLKLI